MKSIQPLQFFSTAQFPCSYIPGRIARNCVIDPDFAMDNIVYADLIKCGFRRSGSQVYRPQCAPCKECISTRIIVDDYKPNRSQRRNWKKNLPEITVLVNEDGFKDSYRSLYEQYVHNRHTNTSTDGVEEFFGSTWCHTHYLEFYLAKRLIGVAVVDVLDEELSAVYTLFEPEIGKNIGLGTFAIMWEIEYAKKLQKKFLYPGYWIEECKKMNYKTNFKPIEGYIDGYWRMLNK